MIRDAQRLILYNFIKTLMSCDSCGHPRMAHKEMTLAVYFCNQCQKVESQVTFTPEKREEKAEGSSTEDMLSDLYWNYKAFRRSTSSTS